jgi:hypothetical protein
MLIYGFYLGLIFSEAFSPFGMLLLLLLLLSCAFAPPRFKADGLPSDVPEDQPHNKTNDDPQHGHSATTASMPGVLLGNDASGQHSHQQHNRTDDDHDRHNGTRDSRQAPRQHNATDDEQLTRPQAHREDHPARNGTHEGHRAHNGTREGHRAGE